LPGRSPGPCWCTGGACRAPLRDWREKLPPEDPPPALACPACGEQRPPWDWDWKGNAGYGRFFVEVEEIFPGEALPSPALDTALADITAAPWRHFHVQDG
jgi:hypothetical protein